MTYPNSLYMLLWSGMFSFSFLSSITLRFILLIRVWIAKVALTSSSSSMDMRFRILLLSLQDSMSSKHISERSGTTCLYSNCSSWHLAVINTQSVWSFSFYLVKKLFASTFTLLALSPEVDVWGFEHNWHILRRNIAIQYNSHAINANLVKLVI